MREEDLTIRKSRQDGGFDAGTGVKYWTTTVKHTRNVIKERRRDIRGCEASSKRISWICQLLREAKNRVNLG